jgi:glycosyltransferase involved in cell wall biosynthesis
MKVLVVINNLECGGAQKSLVSFLNSLKRDSFDLDLLVLQDKTVFFDQIPSWINWMESTHKLRAVCYSLSELLRTRLPYSAILAGLCAKIKGKTIYRKAEKTFLTVWNSWKTHIPMWPKQYDLAISYTDGLANYYVIDKVRAKKKILWMHNEYDKLGHNADSDLPYFAKADGIVTVSEGCVKSLEKAFPTCRGKIHLLYNLSSSKLIWEMAKEEPEEYRNVERRIISIGRLMHQKGFDLSIKAAACLKAKGLSFVWYIIGEGELEAELTAQIEELDLTENVILLGTRKNPYPYLQHADVFVQSSRFEGKSIVLDEAKILHKPIVVTNYETAVDSIIDRVNGTMVAFDENELATAIEELLTDKRLCEQYKASLVAETVADEEQVNTYLDLMNEVMNEPVDDSSKLKTC